jgi:pheromone shutdown protein TraB
MADALAGALPASGRAADVVAALLRVGPFPPEQAADGVLAGLVTHWYEAIGAGDARALAKEIAR